MSSRVKPLASPTSVGKSMDFQQDKEVNEKWFKHFFEDLGSVQEAEDRVRE